MTEYADKTNRKNEIARARQQVSYLTSRISWLTKQIVNNTTLTLREQQWLEIDHADARRELGSLEKHLADLLAKGS